MKKTIFGFIFITLILLLIILFAAYSLFSSQPTTQTKSTELTNQLNTLTDFQKQIYAILNPAKDYLITSDIKERDKYNNLIKDGFIQLKKIRVFAIKNKETKILSDNLEKGFVELEQKGTVLLAIEKPVYSMDSPILIGEMNTFAAGLIDKVEKMRTLMINDFETQNKAVPTINQRNMSILIALVIVLIVVMVLFGFILNKKMSKQVMVPAVTVQPTMKKDEIPQPQIYQSILKLYLLYGISKSISSTTEFEPTMYEFVEQICSSLNLDKMNVMLMNMNRTELYIVTGVGITDEVKDTRIQFGEGIYGTAVKDDQMVLINNVATDSRFKPIKGLDDQINSMLCVPFRSKEQVLGVINAYRLADKIFDQKTIDFIIDIAGQIGMALENARLLEAKKFYCIVDPVTMLYNYRFFLDRLNIEFERARRYKRSLTLLMIDIDHFRNYNNSLGFAQGDKLLKDLSNILEKKVRKSDVVARYGGEEFVIILPETEDATAYILAERLRREIEAYPFVGREKQPGEKVTVSIGIASNIEQLKSGVDLLRNVDSALSHAKEQGRNRVSS